VAGPARVGSCAATSAGHVPALRCTTRARTPLYCSKRAERLWCDCSRFCALLKPHQHCKDLLQQHHNWQGQHQGLSTSCQRHTQHSMLSWTAWPQSRQQNASSKLDKWNSDTCHKCMLSLQIHLVSSCCSCSPTNPAVVLHSQESPTSVSFDGHDRFLTQILCMRPTLHPTALAR
jgi:hypothetical protein